MFKMLIAVSMLALGAPSFAAAPVPLSPLTATDEAPYSGAGCVIQRAGRNIFITDYTGGAVRVGRTLFRMQVVGGELFDPNNAAMETPDGETTLSIDRRPGRVVNNAATETQDIPVRVEFGMFRNNVVFKFKFDAVISCGA